MEGRRRKANPLFRTLELLVGLPWDGVPRAIPFPGELTWHVPRHSVPCPKIFSRKDTYLCKEGQTWPRRKPLRLGGIAHAAIELQFMEGKLD